MAESQRNDCKYLDLLKVWLIPGDDSWHNLMTILRIMNPIPKPITGEMKRKINILPSPDNLDSLPTGSHDHCADQTADEGVG